MRKNECLKIVYAIEPKSIHAQNLSMVDWVRVRVRVRVSVFAVRATWNNEFILVSMWLCQIWASTGKFCRLA